LDPSRQFYELLHGQQRFTTISATFDPCRQCYELLHGQERFTTISANINPCRQSTELLHGQERFTTISATLDPCRQFLCTTAWSREIHSYQRHVGPLTTVLGTTAPVPQGLNAQ
jgi:hypothetical protein